MTVPASESKPKLRWWPALKWLCFALLLGFISRRAWQLWVTAPQEKIQLDWSWLVLAAVAYAVGWLPSVWFWREMLRTLRQPLGIWDSVRAYYVGHMGKYVPGKALVLVIRASLVKGSGVNPLLAGSTAAYETLVFMATGAALALASAPFALGESFWSRIPATWGWLKAYLILWPFAVMGVTFATTPLSAWLFTKICRKMAPGQSTDGATLPAISAGLICQGIGVTMSGWACHAISLGFVLRAISPETWSRNEFPVWLASTTLSTVSGFVVLIAPGGVGVREGLLIEMLKDQPQIGPHVALIAAGLLRAVWFGTELALAGVLSMAHRITKGRRQPR